MERECRVHAQQSAAAVKRTGHTRNSSDRPDESSYDDGSQKKGFRDNITAASSCPQSAPVWLEQQKMVMTDQLVSSRWTSTILVPAAYHDAIFKCSYNSSLSCNCKP